MHISVKSAAVEAAWNLVLPILLEDRNTIKEFKVTDMAEVEPRLKENELARRIYYGAQITVYLHAAPDSERGAVDRFVKLMKSVTERLRAARIAQGIQPASDLQINPYLSFRHDLDDLIAPDKDKELREQEQGEMDEERYRDVAQMRENNRQYGQHKELMKRRPLYLALCKVFPK